jgi:hypothetical protein
MKKIYLSLIILFFGLGKLNSQCLSGSMDGVLSVNGIYQTVSVPMGAPSYFQFNGIAGLTYTFTYCMGGGSYGGDPYLTITNNVPTALAWNDDWCGLGSYVTFICPSTGVYRIYTSGCCPCSNKNSPATLAYVNDGCVGIPNDVTLPANKTICSGKSAELKVTAEDICNWYPTFNSPVILGTGYSFITPTLTPGIYTYYAGINTNNCVSPRIAITITVNPSPIVSIIGGLVPVCTGTTVGLAALGAVNYTWSNNTYTTTTIVTPTANTTYTLIGSDGTCSTSAVRNVSVTPNIAISGTTLYCNGTGTSVLNASGATTYTWNTGSNSSFITVSPTVSTTYTVSGTLAGCTNSRTVSVLISNNPTVSITGSLSLCDGQSTTLTASGASAYFWSNGANTAVAEVSPISSTTVSVIGTNTAGCTGSTVTTLIVYTSPHITIDAPSRICVGEPVTLLANGGATYLWNNGATTSSISVSPSVSTTYTVVGTHTMNSCTRTQTSHIYVDPCTSVKNNQWKATKEFFVYPNPSNGLITVELGNNLNKTIEIIDVTGRVLLVNKTFEEKSDFNISNLSNGIYFVRLNSENKNTMVLKITKQ